MADGALRCRDELAAYLALTQVPGIGAGRVRTLLAACETARAAITAPHGQLAALPGIGHAAAAAVRATDVTNGHAILDALDRIGAGVLLPGDPGFPPLLAEVHEPPVALFVWGDRSLLTRPAAAVVGSRSHTSYGAAAARIIAGGVARCGVVVVSGMARGIDAIAHEAALDAGGATVGVLGNGFGVVYPAAHRDLYDRVARDGCLIAELPPGERPRLHTFPRRNRIIAGLAMATVVVEAAPGSGALITSDHALEQGRNVLAVPGPITSDTSAGCNRLIQQGARPCLSPADVLEELGIEVPVGTRERGEGRGTLPSGAESRPSPQRPSPLSLLPPPDLTPLQRSLWATLCDGPGHVDVLAARSSAAACEVLVALTDLEIRGCVEQRPGMWFALGSGLPAQPTTPNP